MTKIQASARIKIPKGKLEEFKQAAADYIKLVKEKDKGTLQSDWFLGSDKTECEIREIFENSDAVLSHISNLRGTQEAIFKKFGTPYSVTVYGDPSAKLLENARAAGNDAKVFYFLIGGEKSPQPVQTKKEKPEV